MGLAGDRDEFEASVNGCLSMALDTRKGQAVHVITTVISHLAVVSYPSYSALL